MTSVNELRTFSAGSLSGANYSPSPSTANPLNHLVRIAGYARALSFPAGAIEYLSIVYSGYKHPATFEWTGELQTVRWQTVMDPCIAKKNIYIFKTNHWILYNFSLTEPGIVESTVFGRIQRYPPSHAVVDIRWASLNDWNRPTGKCTAGTVGNASCDWAKTVWLTGGECSAKFLLASIISTSYRKSICDESLVTKPINLMDSLIKRRLEKKKNETAAGAGDLSTRGVRQSMGVDRADISNAIVNHYMAWWSTGLRFHICCRSKDLKSRHVTDVCR